MKWKALQMPKEISCDEISENGDYARFVLEPFERGWGVTIGNALRRVLLSSLQGAAVVSVRIEGVDHEYSTIEGVKEDVTDILLNLKQLRIKLISDHDETLRLDVSGDGKVTAANIEENPNVEIQNSDLHIATLNGNASLSIEMHITDGRGYVLAEDLKEEDAPVGTIFLDANFSPVTKVAYHVSDTRVGQCTDFNSLDLEVWTDGTIKPVDAMAYAAKLLVDHFQLFINFDGDLERTEDAALDEERQRVIQLLKMRVDDLELSVRSSNCLRMANIHTLSELVRNKETDMLKYKNFGRKSLVELSEVLVSLNLSFGMDVSEYLEG